MGRWFYKKIDMEWSLEEDKWRKKYPNVSKKMDELEQRLQEVDKWFVDKN